MSTPPDHSMTCGEFEILLADHIDGTLSPARLEAFSAHRETCASCAMLQADAGSMVDFMKRAAAIEPPPELIGRILRATGEDWVRKSWVVKKRDTGLRGWINRIFAPVLQPRFVMGAFLSLMSLTMLVRSLPTQILTAADRDPVRLWTALDVRTFRVWDRAMKTYESTRLVYEVRSQFNEWSEQQQDAHELAEQGK